LTPPPHGQTLRPHARACPEGQPWCPRNAALGPPHCRGVVGGGTAGPNGDARRGRHLRDGVAEGGGRPGGRRAGVRRRPPLGGPMGRKGEAHGQDFGTNHNKSRATTGRPCCYGGSLSRCFGLTGLIRLCARRSCVSLIPEGCVSSRAGPPVPAARHPGPGGSMRRRWPGCARWKDWMTASAVRKAVGSVAAPGKSAPRPGIAATANALTATRRCRAPPAATPKTQSPAAKSAVAVLVRRRAGGGGGDQLGNLEFG